MKNTLIEVLMFWTVKWFPVFLSVFSLRETINSVHNKDKLQSPPRSRLYSPVYQTSRPLGPLADAVLNTAYCDGVQLQLLRICAGNPGLESTSGVRGGHELFVCVGGGGLTGWQVYVIKLNFYLVLLLTTCCTSFVPRDKENIRFNPISSFASKLCCLQQCKN